MKAYKRAKFYFEAARRQCKFYAGCGAMPQQAAFRISALYALVAQKSRFDYLKSRSSFSFA